MMATTTVHTPRRGFIASILAGVAALGLRPMQAHEPDVITPELVAAMRRLSAHDRETLTQIIQMVADSRERLEKPDGLR